MELYVQHPAIETHLTETAALAERLGDRWAQGCASAYLALWNANQGRLEQASSHATIAADFAHASEDDWLRSRAGLAEGWIALRSGRYNDVLATLQPLRRLSFDLQQHQMVRIYLGLSHYGLGHWREAASFLLDADDLALRTSNLRASAATVEVAAFLAMRSACSETCARFLGKAADIRGRTRAPLFSFWVAHDEESTHWARSQLGNERFDALHGSGASARDEVVIDEARTLLREVVEGSRCATEVVAR